MDCNTCYLNNHLDNQYILISVFCMPCTHLQFCSTIATTVTYHVAIIASIFICVFKLFVCCCILWAVLYKCIWNLVCYCKWLVISVPFPNTCNKQPDLFIYEGRDTNSQCQVTDSASAHRNQSFPIIIMSVQIPNPQFRCQLIYFYG